MKGLNVVAWACTAGLAWTFVNQIAFDLPSLFAFLVTCLVLRYYRGHPICLFPLFLVPFLPIRLAVSTFFIARVLVRECEALTFSHWSFLATVLVAFFPWTRKLAVLIFLAILLALAFNYKPRKDKTIERVGLLCCFFVILLPQPFFTPTLSSLPERSLPEVAPPPMPEPNMVMAVETPMVRNESRVLLSLLPLKNYEKTMLQNQYLVLTDLGQLSLHVQYLQIAIHAPIKFAELVMEHLHADEFILFTNENENENTTTLTTTNKTKHVYWSQVWTDMALSRVDRLPIVVVATLHTECLITTRTVPYTLGPVFLVQEHWLVHFPIPPCTSLVFFDESLWAWYGAQANHKLLLQQESQVFPDTSIV